jgi:hypothetical protein
MVKISGRRLRSKDLFVMSCVAYVSKLLILIGMGINPCIPMLLVDCLNSALNLRRPVIMR